MKASYSVAIALPMITRGLRAVQRAPTDIGNQTKRTREMRQGRPCANLWVAATCADMTGRSATLESCRGDPDPFAKYGPTSRQERPDRVSRRRVKVGSFSATEMRSVLHVDWGAALSLRRPTRTGCRIPDTAQ